MTRTLAGILGAAGGHVAAATLVTYGYRVGRHFMSESMPSAFDSDDHLFSGTPLREVAIAETALVLGLLAVAPLVVVGSFKTAMRLGRSEGRGPVTRSAVAVLLLPASLTGCVSALLLWQDGVAAFVYWAYVYLFSTALCVLAPFQHRPEPSPRPRE